jgi:hypothetical protein
MTKEEVFKEITSKLKWHIGFCSQGYATQLVQRFEDNRLSEKTIEKLFTHFGYCVSTPRQWTKQLEGKPSNLKTK